jgi:hypothetical protein
MKKKFWVLVVVAMLSLIPTQRVRADMAPKPSMDFEFVYETDPPLQITDGVLMLCENTNCSQAISPEELDPYGYFSCDLVRCSSVGYNFPGQQYSLVITFSDGKIRESNLFGKEHYEAYYRVIVREDVLVAEETGGYNALTRFSYVAGLTLGIISLVGGLLGGLIITIIVVVGKRKEGDTWRWVKHVWLITARVLSTVLLLVGGFFSLTIPLTAIIELFLGWLYARWKERQKGLVLTLILFANLLTTFWFWSFSTSGGFFRYSWSKLFLSEGIVWLVEAIILYVPMRKTLKFGEALLLSLVLNAVSFGVGLLLPF